MVVVLLSVVLGFSSVIGCSEQGNQNREEQVVPPEDNSTMMPSGGLSERGALQQILLAAGVSQDNLLLDDHCLWPGVECDEVSGRVAKLVLDLQLDANNVSDFSLPDVVMKLTALRSLEIRGKGLKKLPDQFGHWVAGLEKLILNNTSLEKLPKSMENLKKLKVISLDGGSFSSWPDVIASLSSLVEFSAKGNKLTSVSNQMCFHKGLEVLSLDNNQINTLPGCDFGKYQLNLISVSLRGNKLRGAGVDAASLYLEGVKILYLDENELEFFPNSITYFNHLVVLSLRGNKNMAKLPVSLRRGALAALEWLDLANTGLTSLPSYFVSLQSLYALSLNDNGLKALPAGFYELFKLKNLYLARNKFAQFPTSLVKNDKNAVSPLERLDLSGNVIASKMPDLYGNMDNLVWFNVSGNTMEKIPLPSDLKKRVDAGQLTYINQ